MKSIGCFRLILLENGEFWEVVMKVLWGLSTDTSVYNYISNILTLHILLNIINIYSHLSLLQKNILLHSKKAQILLWLFSPRAQGFQGDFFHNTLSLSINTKKNMKNANNADIRGQNAFFRLNRLVENIRFRSKTKANLVKSIFGLSTADTAAFLALLGKVKNNHRSKTKANLVKCIFTLSATDISTFSAFFGEVKNFAGQKPFLTCFRAFLVIQALILQQKLAKFKVDLHLTKSFFNKMEA